MRATTGAASLRTGASLPRVPAGRLWFCIWLPHSAACEGQGRCVARRHAPIGHRVEEQHGIHRILLADAEARAAGVMPGRLPMQRLHCCQPSNSKSAACSASNRHSKDWQPGWSVFRRSSVSRIRMCCCSRLRAACACLVVCGNYGKKFPGGCGSSGLQAMLRLPRHRLAATWLARSGRRACIRDETNLAPALRKLPLACLNWPAGCARH